MDESPQVRALRGATTVDSDTPEQVKERITALLDKMLERNGVDHEDLISIVFTATSDIVSMFPATAARQAGPRRRAPSVRAGARHSRCDPDVHAGSDAPDHDPSEK